MSQPPFVEAAGRRITLPAPACGVHLIGQTAAITDVDGRVHWHRLDAEREPISAHDGPILASCPHPADTGLLTAGDDGRLCAVTPEGAQELYSSGGKWVEHVVASAPTGAYACAVGKQVLVWKADTPAGSPAHRFTLPTTVSGLSLDEKGRRIAISHRDGVSLHYLLMADDKGTALRWPGAHIGVTLHPECSYVVTAMLDLQLHGWRLSDKKDMRMAGYQAKTRAMAWDRRGKWLATSGGDCAVIWPFQGKDGPMGKQPLLLGERTPLVSALAFHPKEDMLAVGYQDGAVLVVRVPDGMAVVIEAPGDGAVEGLAFDEAGRLLAYADAGGRAGIVKLGA